jgi:hypothetical protein
VYYFSYGHLAPGLPPVDVYVDGNLAIEDLAFEEITGYVETRWRPRDLTFKEAGTDRVLVPPTPPAPVRSGAKQTVLLIKAGTERDPTILAYNQPPGSAKPGRVRIVGVNAAADVDRLSVVGNERQKVQSIRYGRGSDALNVPSGKTRVRLETTGDQYKLFTRAYDLADRAEYSAIVGGLWEDGSLVLGLLRDDLGEFEEPIAQIRFLHGLPGVSQLDFRVDGNLLDDSVPYLRRRDYWPLLPLSHRVTANLAGTDVEVVDFGEVQLESDVSITFAAFLDAAGEYRGVRFEDPDEPADVETARVRFLHLAPIEDAADVYLDDVLVFEGVPPGGITEYVRIDPGSRRVEARDLAGETLAPVRSLGFGRGEDFTVVLDGLPDGDPALALTRIDDDRY